MNSTTKKITLSAVVIVAFVGYAVEQYVSNKTPADTKAVDTSSTGTDTTAVATTTSQYKDGSYSGKVADAYFGNLQVQVTITGGKIANVIYLQYPNDRRESTSINQRALPILNKEVVAAQKAQVNIVSGATQTSDAFIESLQSALTQAKV